MKKLIIASIFLMSALITLLPSTYAQDVFDNCGMEGNAKPQEVRDLNKLKNRYTAPETKDFNQNVSLEAVLEPGDDENRWSSSQAAELTGYVYDVKVGGIETCNCHARDLKHRDTHIELIIDPDQNDKTQRVIVEVTPRWRKMMKDKGVDWSTPTLKKTLMGKQVKIKGWLLFDKEHKYQSENTNPGADGNWRATAWEIHPITDIEIIPSSNEPANENE